MQKVKNTIPVYDICSLTGQDHIHHDLIAEPFAAYLKVHPNLHLAHRHSFYHIVFFTEGTGFHIIDFEQFDVRAGQIYFMIPGQVHSWNFEGHTDGFVINFSEDLFRSFLSDAGYLHQFSFFRGAAHDSVVQLTGQAYDVVLSCLKKIAEEVSRQNTHALDMVRAALVELCITVQRNCPQPAGKQAQGQNQLILRNFRQMVEQYYAEKRLPKDYAAMLYITPNHLNALCKDLLGRPAGEVIRDRILLEAKRLLINAGKGIAEIAFSLGFSDNAHFTRFFKKHTDATPEAFRKAVVGKN